MLGLPYWTLPYLPILLQIRLWIEEINGPRQMPLEKYEDFLELSVKQFGIQSSPISLGQIMWGIWKTKH